MKILVANLGSTSLKYRLFDCSGGEERMLTRGGFERVQEYSEAIDSCLDELKSGGWISDESELAAVGFKPILAKGITGCVLMDEAVLAAMEECNCIAPAHNPPYVEGVRKFAGRMPETPMIGLFETAFYQWAPEEAMRYAVPEQWYEMGVRRWGYHGASHKFIAERSAELLGRDDVAARSRTLYVNNGGAELRGTDLRVISCHLGGSSSITGILNGAGIGNSLGMSPQSGLPHNNRVGDLDSFAVPFIMRRTGCDVAEVERMLCKESGLKGLSGGFNDLRDVLERAAHGDARAQLAFRVLVHHARHWIGAFLAELNGADAIVFTAGIGENNPQVRDAVCRGLDQLGVKLDADANSIATGIERKISAADSPVQAWVIPTNEELVIAREAKRFLECRSGT
ncbi:MAG: acetate kinase [Verrucomicrobia bacterium]|nr:acetate kinase [Verrucomicrobiota bacterium]